jgi:SulP family sulfate permease
MERTSRPNIAVLGLNAQNELINIIREKDTRQCSNIKIVRIDGSLYFGSIEKIANYINQLYEENEYQHLLIAADGINFIDLAAAEWLTHEIQKWQDHRGGIYFSGLKLVSQDVLLKGGFKRRIGHEVFFIDKKSAIHAIHQWVKRPCKSKVFDECKTSFEGSKL